MGKIINVLDGPVSVKYNDVFSMKELYNFVRDWILETGFTNESSEKWMEKYYYENISQTSGKEIVIWWRTERESSSKYIKHYLNIDFRVLAMKDVEITHNNKKIKANKGEVEIILNGFAEYDPNQKFEKDKMVGTVMGFNIKDYFEKNLHKSNIQSAIGDLTKDVKSLQENIKNFLEMHPIDSGELFRPKRGL